MNVKNYEIMLADYDEFKNTLSSKTKELEENGNVIVDTKIDTILRGNTNKYDMDKVVNQTTYYAKIIYFVKEWDYEG